MISYSDMVTILLILFMGAAANLGARAKTAEVRQSAVKQVETPAPKASPTELERTQRIFEAQGFRAKVEERGLVVTLSQEILFDSGEDVIRPEAIELVGEVAAILRTIPNRVNLIGHSDAVPIHTRQFEDNWHLSAARSLRLLKVLSEQYGIAEARLSISSLGPFHPLGSNETDEGRAENRRVEIVVLPDGRL